MSRFKHINLSIVKVMMTTLFVFFVALSMNVSAVYAQEELQEDVVAEQTDSIALESDADVADESEDAAATIAAPAAPAASSAATAAVEESTSIDPQAYKNFFYGILLVLLVSVVVVIVGKILSIYELTTKMNGKFNPLAGNNFQATLLLIALPIFLYGVYWSYVNHGSMAWRDAVTEHGKRIDVMFIITTIITTIVLVLMHILLFTFSYKYRMRLKGRAYFYPHNNTIEKIWTIVPAIVLTVLVLFGFFTWRSITNVPEDLQKSAIQIEVLGEQFAWTVRYPGRDGEFGPRNYKLTTPMNPYGIDFSNSASFDDVLGSEIVLPVNKPVRFHIMSKDILHSFYIPDFRVQINAVPGMTTYFQFTPTVTTQDMRDRMDDQSYDFVMLCNKICGTSHFNMQKRVRVVTEEEYQAWLNEQTYFFNEEVQKEFANLHGQEEGSISDAKVTEMTAYNN